MPRRHREPGSWPTCAGTLKNGRQCAAAVITGSRYCGHHAEKEIGRWLEQYEQGDTATVTLPLPLLADSLRDLDREALTALGLYIASHHADELLEATADYTEAA
ncbi:MAG: hypothetical protein H0V45_12930 [Actinobacteria bacterium]|nr:hypothetical protein [Actinomycetota bacterium]